MKRSFLVITTLLMVNSAFSWKCDPSDPKVREAVETHVHKLFFEEYKNTHIPEKLKSIKAELREQVSDLFSSDNKDLSKLKINIIDDIKIAEDLRISSNTAIATFDNKTYEFVPMKPIGLNSFGKTYDAMNISPSVAEEKIYNKLGEENGRRCLIRLGSAIGYQDYGQSSYTLRYEYKIAYVNKNTGNKVFDLSVTLNSHSTDIYLLMD